MEVTHFTAAAASTATHRPRDHHGLSAWPRTRMGVDNVYNLTWTEASAL
jgi:hypothetical protein